MNMDSFPDEIWIHILHFLEPSDLLKCIAVNQHFNHLTSTDIIWEPIWTNLLENKFTKFIVKRLESVKTKKLCYFNALRDAKRTSISLEELYSIRWIFTFGGDDAVPYFPYFKNNMYYNEARYGTEGIPFELSFSNRRITIEHMPVMHFKRTSDWGWIFKHNGITINMLCDELPECDTDYKSRLDLGKKQKDIGNAYFVKGKYWRSIQEYRKGMVFITHEEDPLWAKEYGKLVSVLSCNIATAAMRINNEDSFLIAFEAASFSFSVNPKNEKALFRKILAMRELNIFGEEALEEDATLLRSFGSKDENIIQLCKEILDKPQTPIISIM